MASLPSPLARGYLRSRRLPRVHAISLRFQHAPPSIPQEPPLDVAPPGRVDLFPSTRATPGLDTRIAGRLTVPDGIGRAQFTSSKNAAVDDLVNALKPLGISYPLVKALLREFAHFRHPTSAQVALLKSVLKDGNDVFLKEKTGRGKTFAMTLIALSRALKIRTKRTKAAPRNARNARNSSASVLLLLPHATLVEQVAGWIARLQGAIEGIEHEGPLAHAVMPGDRPPQGNGRSPDIMISTPDALLAYLQHPCAPLPSRHNPSTSSLSRSLQLLMVDEVDAMLRPLPGRFKTFASERERSRHPFYRHPPSIVRLLNNVLRINQDSPVQTVWSSATLNSVVRGFIQRSGWIRRAEQTMIDTTQDTPGLASISGPVSRNIVHHCLVVDPLTGQMRNLGAASEPEVSDLVTLGPTDPGSAERIHPLMIENLALLFADRLQKGTPGHALAIIPSGASMTSLQQSLSSLGISSAILDSAPPSTSTLLLIDRAHVRGLDLSSLTTVYLLNGLDATHMSKSSRAAGGMEDRKREYTHFAGRMDRLGAVAQDRYEIVSLVMRGSGEEEALKGMVVGRADLRVDRKEGAGIEA